MTDEARFSAGHIRMHPGDRERAYSCPDPTAESYREAAWQARYGQPTRTQLYTLASAAEALDHFLTHPAGTEHVVRQIRELRRAIRGKP